MPGKMVTADAQFGIARILRPWNGALSLTGPYEGQPVSTQIMLTEVLTSPGGAPLDPFAETGSAGYASNLIKGLDVPIGSRVILWLPAIQSGGIVDFRYSWSITWRLRNVYDYRNARMPFHFPKQGEGVPIHRRFQRNLGLWSRAPFSRLSTPSRRNLSACLRGRRRRYEPKM